MLSLLFAICSALLTYISHIFSILHAALVCMFVSYDGFAIFRLFFASLLLSVCRKFVDKTFLPNRYNVSLDKSFVCIIYHSRDCKTEELIFSLAFKQIEFCSYLSLGLGFQHKIYFYLHCRNVFQYNIFLVRSLFTLLLSNSSLSLLLCHHFAVHTRFCVHNVKQCTFHILVSVDWCSVSFVFHLFESNVFGLFVFLSTSPHYALSLCERFSQLLNALYSSTTVFFPLRIYIFIRLFLII